MLKRNRFPCRKLCNLEEDDYILDFTPSMDWEQRSLLMSAVFLIDFVMFEKKHNFHKYILMLKMINL